MSKKVYTNGQWLEENNQNIIDGKRAVAFMDILGFKNLIETYQTSDLGMAYMTAIMNIEGLNKKRAGFNSIFPNHPIDVPLCKKFIFSDSIIFISNGDSKEEALKTLIATWKTMQYLIAAGLPVRGAVTFDEIFINPQNNIFLGKALTKAYLLEQTQEWVGGVIDESLFTSFQELKNEVENEKSIYNKLFLKYKVPLKEDAEKEYYTINWRAGLILTDRKDDELFKFTNDKNIDKKFNNTLEYCKKALYFFEGENVPIEFTNMYFGSKRP